MVNGERIEFAAQILKPIVYFLLLRLNLHHFRLFDFNTAVLLHPHSTACLLITVHKTIPKVSGELFNGGMRQNFGGST